MATEELYDVDDGPLLRKRRMVMTMCTVQIVVSLALLANARRNLVLLVLNPFFVAAGALGYVGAKRCQPLLVMAHFLGSAGLSLLFGLFVLAEVRARSLIPLTTHRPPTTYCFFTRPSSSAPALTCSTLPSTCRWTCCCSVSHTGLGLGLGLRLGLGLGLGFGFGFGLGLGLVYTGLALTRTQAYTRASVHPGPVHTSPVGSGSHRPGTPD